MGAKGDKKFEEIIEVAVKEFTECGYENTTMQNIAQKAGLSKGGLYHHFSSKAEILFVLNATIINSIKEICDRIDLRPTAEEGLNQFIEEYISFWLTKPDELQLYFITFNYAYKDERIVELYSSSNEYLRSKISLAFEKMNIRFEIQNSQKSELIDAKARSLALMSCLDGYLGNLLFETQIEPDRMIKEIQRIFVK